MEIKKILRRMDITLVVLITLLVVAVVAAFWKGGWQLTGLGLVQAGRLIETVWLRLLIGLTLGGLIQVLIPRAVIARWLGPTSGIKGIIIGSYTGIILGGPPYVCLPVVASLYVAGAGAGPIIALLTGNSLLGIQNLIAWQIPFLGVGIPLSKYIVCLFVTPIVGFVGSLVFKLLAGVPELATESYDVVASAEQQGGEKKISQAADKREKT